MKDPYEPRPAAEILASCNALANKFAQAHRHISRPEFKYYEATHPPGAGILEFGKHCLYAYRGNRHG